MSIVRCIDRNRIPIRKGMNMWTKEDFALMEARKKKNCSVYLERYDTVYVFKDGEIVKEMSWEEYADEHRRSKTVY